MKKIFVTLTAIIMVSLIALGMAYVHELNTEDETVIETTMVETTEEVETTTEVIENNEDDVKHMIHISHDIATGKVSIDL